MKIHHILYMAGLSAMMAACSSDDVLQQTEGSRVPIGLSYTTQPQVDTRAAASTTLNNDYIEVGKKVKVRISNHGADDWKEYTYTTGENGALALPTTPKYAETDADGVPYYPLNAETHVDIKAYYPADAVSSGSSSFSIRTDQTDDDAYTASDLMWAEPLEDKEKTTSNQTLTFSHKMAKIIVNVAAGTAVSQINSVTLKNIKPTVTFNKGTGVISALTGEAGDVKIVKEETATNVSGAAVIPEQAIDGQLLAVGVTLNDNTTTGTAYYMVNKTFTAGNVYTLNITVSYPEVEAETAIIGWTEGDVAYSSKLDIEITEEAPYLSHSTPTVRVTDRYLGTTLTEGIDYNLYYENNESYGDIARVIAYGIGESYSGHAAFTTYTIDSNGIPLSAVTSSEVGYCISDNGLAFESATMCQLEGLTPIALVAYVGEAGSIDSSSDNYKGLALALTDINGSETIAFCDQYGPYCGLSYTTNAEARANPSKGNTFLDGITCTSTYITGISGHTHAGATALTTYRNEVAVPSGVSDWFLPSMGQWNVIVKSLVTKAGGTASDLVHSTVNANMKSSVFANIITNAGGIPLQNGIYRSCTETDDPDSSRPFLCPLSYRADQGWMDGYQSTSGNHKSALHYMRAIFAF